MLVLVAYDVDTTDREGRKRLHKVARECVNYGQRVQNSVFECSLSQNQFIGLKNRLEGIIQTSTDSIRFYNLGNNAYGRITVIGRNSSYKAEEVLLVI